MDDNRCAAPVRDLGPVREHLQVLPEEFQRLGLIPEFNLPHHAVRIIGFNGRDRGGNLVGEFMNLFERAVFVKQFSGINLGDVEEGGQYPLLGNSGVFVDFVQLGVNGRTNTYSCV